MTTENLSRRGKIRQTHLTQIRVATARAKPFHDSTLRIKLYFSPSQTCIFDIRFFWKRWNGRGGEEINKLDSTRFAIFEGLGIFRLEEEPIVLFFFRSGRLGRGNAFAHCLFRSCRERWSATTCHEIAISNELSLSLSLFPWLEGE